MTHGNPPGGVQRAVGAAARGLSALAQAANASGTLVVLALVLLIIADVLARNLLHAPFPGAFELVQFLMVMIVFLQLPDVIRTNRLTRSDGFLEVLAARRPGAARTLARLIDAASAAFLALIAVAIWPEFLRAWRSGAFMGTPGVFSVPYWPIHLAIFASGALSALIFVTKAVSGRRRPDRPDREAAAHGPF